MNTDILVIIPARGGSKGLPGKNIRPLLGKPLINYSIDIARSVVCDENICVSTDDEKIRKTVEDYGLVVPFLRPIGLATDTTTTNDVLLHALNFYLDKGMNFKKILLLQPTSPLRKEEEVKEAISLYRDECDMVVSVALSHAPAVLCNENEVGYLNLIYNRKMNGRQVIEKYYEYNGAIYVINALSLKEKGMASFNKIIKYVMPKESSIDIDDIYDFYLVESILKNKK